GGGSTSVTVSNNVTVTNQVTLSVTNEGPDLSGLTNLLGEIRHNQTNDHGLGSFLGLDNVVSAVSNAMNLGTNLGVATYKAEAALDDVLGSATDLSDVVEGGPPESAGSGDGGMLTFDFCGHELCLDPLTNWPALCGAVYSVISWLILWITIIWCGQQYIELIRLHATTQLGGVPNLSSEIPVVGNLPGVIIALAVPTVFVVSCLAIWRYVFGGDFGLRDKILSVQSANPFAYIGAAGSAGSVALYLLNGLVPLQLLLSCLWIRLFWYFVAGKLIFVWVFVARYLWGK
ncbi:MAG: hypothetical protein H7835_18580, partial [Magnetococcus sp. XQGC-1]